MEAAICATRQFITCYLPDGKVEFAQVSALLVNVVGAVATLSAVNICGPRLQ